MSRADRKNRYKTIYRGVPDRITGGTKRPYPGSICLMAGCVIGLLSGGCGVFNKVRQVLKI